LLFKTDPCVGGVGAWTEFSGRLASDGRSLYSAWGNVYMDIYRNTFPRNGLCCLSKNYEDSVKDSNYVGAVLQTDLIQKQTVKFATGFRNPQGLYYDRFRRILWLSDHGPRGGDELNYVRRGSNYGYPYVTLGRPYLNASLNSTSVPQVKYGTHAGYTPPIFSWTPSIAPSQITTISSKGTFAEWWANDVVVSSLKDKSLQRIKLLGNGRVLYSERIDLGDRIRDITQAGGYLVASTDDGAILLLKTNSKVPEGTFPQKN